jgi:YYY domain-containing protein
MTRLQVALTLFVIVMAGAAFRFHGIGWDEGRHLHPDERFVTMVVDKIRFPSTVEGYLDTARSPLNPYNQGFEGYAYGMLPLFLTRAVAAAVDMATYDKVLYAGRALSAVFDLGTIVLTFLVGRLVGGAVVGLLAAAIVSTNVLHIQLSHFLTVDTFLTFFTTGALWFACRGWRSGRPLDFAALGLFAGMAMASKASAVLLAPLVLVAAVAPTAGGAARSLARVASNLLVCGLATFLAYRLGEPYSFDSRGLLGMAPNWQRFTDLDRWVRISSGDIEVPFMVQWARTPNPWFALDNLVQWGFGPVVGVVALAGLAVAAGAVIRSRQVSDLSLVALWALINLAYFGFQFAKFMRYFLPAYPALAIVVAVVIVWLARWLQAREPIVVTRGIGYLIVVAVVGASTVWALAFSAIYTAPNTRVTASTWIYDNVAPGSTIAVEHWDDELPLGMPGRERRFTMVSMTLYDDESVEKRRKIVDGLNRAQYLVLASNRLSGSIPRLFERFPLGTEYYRLLFEGGLGFTEVARFNSPPRLGSWIIDSSTAQEDFTVYDHPTVIIFRKAPEFDRVTVESRLAAVPLDSIDKVKPVDAGKARGSALLTPDERADVATAPGWAARFSFDSFSSHVPVIAWLLAVELVTLAALPLMIVLLPALNDRGLAAARIIGLVIVAYVAWLLASLDVVWFGPIAVWVGVGVLAAMSALTVGVGAFRERAFTAWQGLLGPELVFLATFGLMMAMRAVNPDLWHSSFGGEKPMDFAYLNAVVRSPSFPPYDPWFAGGAINYYYWGFVLVATLVHLSGVPPHQAYNLAIATVFAMTAAGAYAFAYTLASRGRSGFCRSAAIAGVASIVAMLILGNLDGVVQLRDSLFKLDSTNVSTGVPLLSGLVSVLSGLVAAAGSPGSLTFDFWRSTRFIGPEEPGPIHEFPFFTFLYGDLHAHMLSLPLQVAVVLLGFQLTRGAWPRLGGSADEILSGVRGGWRSLGRIAALVSLVSLLVGALRATNTWDFPTYLAFGALCVALGVRASLGPSLAVIAGVGVAAAAAIFVGSTVLFAPFLARYELGYAGVVPVPTPTRPYQFLLVNGFLLLIVVSWLAVSIGRLWRVASARGGVGGWRDDISATAIGAAVICIVGSAVVLGRGSFMLAAVVSIAALVVALTCVRSPRLMISAAVAATAAGALALPEVIAIKGDVGRMNTVFKFFLQGWLLMALLAGPAVVWLWTRGTRSAFRPGFRAVWCATVVALAMAAAIYPVRAAPAKLSMRLAQTPPTLDGMAFMETARYEQNGRDVNMPADHAAIRWMLENVEGNPVILEAQGPLYHWTSRFSIYTGLPTVIGWDWHQKQQRTRYTEQVDRRIRDVKQAYESPNPADARSVIARYGVKYIVVGGLERAYYPAAGLQKFQSMVGADLALVYNANGVSIYRVADV